MAATDDQHSRFWTENAFIKQPLQGGFVEIIPAFIPFVLPRTVVHPRQAIRPLKSRQQELGKLIDVVRGFDQSDVSELHDQWDSHH